MKRSALNQICREAQACFTRHHWALPPSPHWDVTDFGLGDFDRYGLVLVNLATEPEYCEKLMYARRGQTTPCHTHARKKEDIICRHGELGLRLWPARPDTTQAQPVTFAVPLNGVPLSVRGGELFPLAAGSRVTLVPGVWHEFAPLSDDCIIGEVSTANDDQHDNFFLNPAVGRFPRLEEDEPALIRLLSES
ncbi:D-lyxose ketol-isomerase [Lacunisphaera limnophila]|uniref:D-lyxose ketol-isomerase n=1 Tax=Lacunisphaera limnophila TaxID=1838286 RepID=A0A1D8ARG6_9BACT|nr:D-lyxose/D-mannose family sugar isomerase [Lacunisphaera limnophila]AOS43484.1 D-lyxose ketol-isomerase [Lacunisphaera limnophila]